MYIMLSIDLLRGLLHLLLAAVRHWLCFLLLNLPIVLQYLCYIRIYATRSIIKRALQHVEHDP